MLLQFSVENFLSFDGLTHFSMRATDETDHPGHVLRRGQHRAVRGAALYGANAAGKSNLVQAMGFARDVIVKGAPVSGVRPFRLREGATRASGFHWQWLHARKKWSYGFDILAGRVVEEYLFSQPEDGGEEELWFERKEGEQIKIGEVFVAGASDEEVYFRQLFIRRAVPESELFLRRCLDNQINSVSPVFEWFEEVLLIVQAESNYQRLVVELHEEESFLDFISEQIRNAGTGIKSIKPMKVTMNPEIVIVHPDGNQETIGDFWNSQSNGANVGETFSISVSTGVTKDTDNLFTLKSFYAVHQSQGREEEFHLEEESEGTQRYLHLLPRLYRLQTRPTVLVIDELERRLHTLLTRRFVEQAIGVEPLPESQLVFTTHDTNLLDARLLRRDEIWFVDKNDTGASSLFSLAAFADFRGTEYERAYLLGLFEAIPYFRNSHQLSPALREAPPSP